MSQKSDDLLTKEAIIHIHFEQLKDSLDASELLVKQMKRCVFNKRDTQIVQQVYEVKGNDVAMQKMLIMLLHKCSVNAIDDFIASIWDIKNDLGERMYDKLVEQLRDTDSEQVQKLVESMKRDESEEAEGAKTPTNPSLVLLFKRAIVRTYFKELSACLQADDILLCQMPYCIFTTEEEQQINETLTKDGNQKAMRDILFTLLLKANPSDFDDFLSVLNEQATDNETIFNLTRKMADPTCPKIWQTFRALCHKEAVDMDVQDAVAEIRETLNIRELEEARKAADAQRYSDFVDTSSVDRESSVSSATQTDKHSSSPDHEKASYSNNDILSLLGAIPRDKTERMAYQQPGCDIYACLLKYNNEQISMQLWDTNGFGLVRQVPGSYPKKDVVLICYSIQDRESFQRIVTDWEHEIAALQRKKHSRFILVATDLEKRSEEQSPNESGLVSREEGERLASEIMASDFVECSAKTSEGIHELLEKVVALRVRKIIKDQCVVS